MHTHAHTCTRMHGARRTDLLLRVGELEFKLEGARAEGGGGALVRLGVFPQRTQALLLEAQRVLGRAARRHQWLVLQK
jgi:hypothetical protein